jgi:hypothetical protein
MQDPDRDQLKCADKSRHAGTATHVQSVLVTEMVKGKMVWEGVVQVFDLADNPKATSACAWSSPIQGSTQHRLFAVLHSPPITSPVEAVRAVIVAEHRAANDANR